MFLILSFGTKILYWIIKTLGLGAGLTWPGHLVLKLYPNIPGDPAVKFSKGLVLVTGTNGKTTTSKLIATVLQKKGFTVAANSSGANLVNGVVTAVLISYRGRAFDYGVFEVDEAALVSVLKYLNPTHVLFLNLSRDQLDRHWEPDLLLDKWVAALKELTTLPRVITDVAQEEFEVLDQFSPLHFSGTKPVELKGNEVYYKDSVVGTTVLTGPFNEKNFNAALVCLQNTGVEIKESVELLANVGFAFGRGEKVVLGGKNLAFFLAKNPASFNTNLIYLSAQKDVDTFIFVLNANIPDGRDVSWIYDILPEKLAQACAGKKIYVTGSRCLDMAVRLRYAGLIILAGNVSPDIKKVVRDVLEDPQTRNITVLPNYSAMLEVRKILLGRKIL